MFSLRLLLLACTFSGIKSTPIGSLPIPQVPDINGQFSNTLGSSFDIGNVHINGGLDIKSNLEVTNKDAAQRRSDPINIVVEDPQHMNPQDNTVHIVQPMDVQHPATSAFQPVLQGVGDFANNLVMIPTSIVQGFNQAGGTASIFNPLNNAFSPLKDSFTPLTDAVANPLAGANAFGAQLGAGAAQLLAAKATLAAPLITLGSTVAAPFVKLGAIGAGLVVKGKALVGAKILAGAALKAAVIAKGAALGSAILGKKALLLGGIASGASAVSTGLFSAAGAPFVVIPAAAASAATAGLGALASPILAPLSLFNIGQPAAQVPAVPPATPAPAQVFVIQNIDGKTVLVPVEIDASKLPPVDPKDVVHLKIDHPGLGINVDTAGSNTAFNVNSPLVNVKGDAGSLGTNVLVDALGTTVNVNTNEVRTAQGFRAF